LDGSAQVTDSKSDSNDDAQPATGLSSTTVDGEVEDLDLGLSLN